VKDFSGLKSICAFPLRSSPRRSYPSLVPPLITCLSRSVRSRWRSRRIRFDVMGEGKCAGYRVRRLSFASSLYLCSRVSNNTSELR
jgi:hypothetical protein